jgi:hypothetical protein
MALLLTALVAIEHVYILWLEMFAWESRGPKVFKGVLRPELFPSTKILTAKTRDCIQWLSRRRSVLVVVDVGRRTVGPEHCHVFSFLRGRRRPVWRGDCLENDSLRAGCAGPIGHCRLVGAHLSRKTPACVQHSIHANPGLMKRV